MKYSGLGMIFLIALSAYGAEPGRTGRPTNDDAPGGGAATTRTTGGRKAVRLTAGLPVPRSGVRIEPLPSDSGWTLIDYRTLHRMIPAGERLAVKFDAATETLSESLLSDPLTSRAHQAVAVAPTWLQDDLADNLRRIAPTLQNQFADMILHCPDKRYYDELCFQVAHLSPVTLMYVPPQLLVDNVQQAYQIDRELQYVDIVDYGDPLQGGDYYSTTRYQAIVNGETTSVEIPRDIYYWWVIMPKITDEQPQYLYGYFWREYLYYCCDSGYPLLREKLANTRVLWNGQMASWGGNGVPFDDSLPAVAVVGRWSAYTVPSPAQGNRPIQPIQIAHEHDGNWGEMQDILCAAARTALIPCGGVCDINEDHVWCEVWWQDSFRPYQVDLGGGSTYIKNPGIAYDRKYGGGKNVSGVWDWRNDGWQRSVVGTYSDVCTLTVEVRDSLGRPVDGAVVRLYSEDWYGGFADCFYGVTDRWGRYATTLGDWQNYYLRITSPWRTLNAGLIVDSAECTPGSRFFYPCSLSGCLDSLVIAPDTGAPRYEYRMDVTYDVNHEALYGSDCYNSNGSNVYALAASPGAVDFCLAGADGFRQYLAGEAFPAFIADENTSAANHSLILARPGNHYAVFSNEEQANLTVFLDATVRLYRWSAAVAESPAATPGPAFWIAANPFHRLELQLRNGGRVRILDRTGRVVHALDASPGGRAVWDGTDLKGRPVSPGVYFCQVLVGGRELVRPVVFVGGAR
jgi:hypothetical protein